MGPLYPSSSETSPSPPPAPVNATDATAAQTTTIDAGAFPHIIDLIVEYAPHASLLALRSVSRPLRSLVDARLACHLILPGPGEGVSSPVGRVSALYPLLPMLGKEADDNDDAWCACVAHTRVVTLHAFETFVSSSEGQWELWDAMNVLSSFLKNIETVCINQRPGGSRIIPAEARLAPLPAANVVVFATVTSPATMAHREAFRTLSGRKRGPDPYVYLPRSTRRLVLHITYDRIDQCMDGGFVNADNVQELEHLQELVVIFKYEPERVGDSAQSGDSDATVPPLVEMPGDYRRFSAWGALHSIRRVLNSYAAYHSERMGQTQFTVVDLPNVHPSVLGLADDTAREDFGPKLVRSIVYREWTNDWLYDPDQLCQQFEFIGADEYRSRVGEERWETETLCSESPVSKRRAEA